MWKQGNYVYPSLGTSCLGVQTPPLSELDLNFVFCEVGTILNNEKLNTVLTITTLFRAWPGSCLLRDRYKPWPWESQHCADQHNKSYAKSPWVSKKKWWGLCWNSRDIFFIGCLFFFRERKRWILICINFICIYINVYAYLSLTFFRIWTTWINTDYKQIINVSIQPFLK